MALPSSGAIRAGADVNVELGNSSTTQISLGQASVRSLYGVASGAIRLAADGYGKSGGFSATISTNQQELNLRTWALANGWNGTSAATITVGSNVYIWSSSITIPGLTINGSWPAGITVINNGFIMGKGGNGGQNNNGTTTAAQNGGSAISLGVNASITNNSYIGGGGGGGAHSNYSEMAAGSGGGAGGGSGGTGYNDAGGVAGGGAGGSVGNSGSNGSVGYSELGGAYGTYFYYNGGGGGGGRIFPGTGGAVSAAAAERWCRGPRCVGGACQRPQAASQGRHSLWRSKPLRGGPRPAGVEGAAAGRAAAVAALSRARAG